MRSLLSRAAALSLVAPAVVLVGMGALSALAGFPLVGAALALLGCFVGLAAWSQR